MDKRIKTILASSSPRRLELLNLINIYPEVLRPHVNENKDRNESIDSFIKRISIEKGNYSRNSNNYNDLIISADTIVLLHDRMIGKPLDRNDAFKMLRLLSGNIHKVITGVSIFYRDKNLFDRSVTDVQFIQLTEEEINIYLDNEEYNDKAGAYAIQGKASVFIDNINGCYFNVMGFPLNLFYMMLKKIGLKLENISEIGISGENAGLL